MYGQAKESQISQRQKGQIYGGDSRCLHLHGYRWWIGAAATSRKVVMQHPMRKVEAALHRPPPQTQDHSPHPSQN
jgi:hypothetical protein